ncbi:hypothetical protein BX070DRAFT_225622 [Coemansia spiralis]|nr:hypothetical protein BX070DRAFT_225622 [Coemansia spiralis]
MASSLASQLYQMRNVDRIISTERAQKIRASFLFEGRQAADMDNQTVFDIGRDGLEELCKINRRFDVYADTLFSEAVKDLDRVLQTKEENKKLDESIRSFLFQLAPHFLTKPAGKALEWLVRRFRIQEFNVRDILAALLPYHETKAFLTMLTIITFDTQDMNIFGFLVAQRKARRLLDRATLMSQCMRDRSLMAFICNSVFSAVKAKLDYPGLHSFYVMITTQYIGQLQVIDDSTIQFVLPYVLDGLNQDTKDSQTAAYMILGSLAARITFTQDALEKVLCAVAQDPTDTRSMCMCLIQLLQSQVSTAGAALSSRFLKLLAGHKAFPRVFCSLAKDFDIELVVRTLLGSLFNNVASDSELSSMLSVFVPIIPLTVAPILCELFVNECISAALRSSDTSSLFDLFDLLRLRYSQQLEDAIGAAANNLVERSDLNKAQKEIAHKTLYNLKLRGSMDGASSVLPLKETATTLYLSINHVDSGIRLVAAKALGDIIAGENTEFTLSKEDIGGLILERLQYEDDVRVLELVLSLPLANFISSGDLVPALVGIIESGRVSIKHISEKVVTNILSIDCSEKFVYDQVSSAIFPYLLEFATTKPVTSAIFSCIRSSKFGEQHGWLSRLASVKADPKASAGQRNKQVVDLLASELVKHWSDLAAAESGLWAFKLASSAQLPSRIVAVALGAQAVSLFAESKDAKNSVNAASDVVTAALDILSTCSCKPTALVDGVSIDSTTSASWSQMLADLSSARDFEGAAAKMATGVLSSVISTLPSVCKLQANMWFAVVSQANELSSCYRELLRSMFVSIVSRAGELRNIEGILIGRLLGVCVGDEWAEFLASIWLSNTSSVARSRCLLVFKALVQHKSADENVTGIDYQTVLPSLVAVLSDPEVQVRSAAVACIKTLKYVYPPASDKKQKSHSSKRANETPQQDIYKYDEFYGKPSDKLQYLPFATAARFVSLLAACSDTIVSDVWAIKTELGSILNKGVTNSSSGAHFKLNSQGRESVVTYLLSHIIAADTVAPALQIRLLDALELVSSVCFLEQLPMLISAHIERLGSLSDLPKRGGAEDMLIRALFSLCYTSSNAQRLVSDFGGKYWTGFLGYVAGVAQDAGVQTSSTWTHKDFVQAYMQQLAFERLASNFVTTLGPDAVSALTACLFGVVTRGNSYFVQDISSISLRDLFRTVPLDPGVAADELNAIAEKLASDDNDSARSAKRQRSSRVPEASALLPELATLLEYVQCSPCLSSDPLIVPALFALLSVFISDISPSINSQRPSSADSAETKQVSLEYIMQLVLTMLTRIIDDANASATSIAESVIRVDIIVQTIRTSTSPQTHNQTLLLLAAVAAQHPELVLHHVMAIFTFMGANVLRQDDEYSFHVIQQTLEKVIPPLVKADPEHLETVAARVAQAGPVLRVFVDTLTHIPRHRRMALFTTLVSTMGADMYAPAVVSLLLERNVERILKSGTNKTEGPTKETEDTLAFALSLTHSLSGVQQVKSVNALVEDISVLPAECAKQDDSAKKNDAMLDDAAARLYIDLARMNNKQLRTYRLVALDFAHKLLTSRQFMDKLKGVKDTAELNRKLSDSAETLLRAIALLSSQHSQLSLQGRLETSIAERAWKQSVQMAYSVLDDVNSIMGQQTFVKTVCKLLSHSDLKVRRKVMALANTKLREFDMRNMGKDSPVIDSVLEMITPIASIAEQKTDSDLSADDAREFLACKQTALLCIATAAKKFAALRPVIFTSIVKMVSCAESLGSSNPVISSAALVALSVLCNELGSRLIPSLPQYLPSVLKHLHSVVSRFKSANADDLALMISALSAMQAIVENMPAFLAPSLPPLFACLFSPSIRSPIYDDAPMADCEKDNGDDRSASDSDSSDVSSSVSETKKQNTSNIDIAQLREQANRLADDVLNALAKNIPPRQLLNAQFAFYQKEASRLGTAIIVSFISFVGKTGGHLQQNDLVQFYKPLFKFFLTVFDLARSPAIPLSDVETIEQATLDAFMRFVVKLNENLFKPLFLSFIEWATADYNTLSTPQQQGTWASAATGRSKKNDKRARQQSASETRLRVFYRVLNMLFDKLKSILTPYYSSVIDTTVAQLDRFGVSLTSMEAQEEEDRAEKPAPSALWCAVVESIYQSALHDTSNFWNDSTFKRVFRSLANQLPNTKAPGGTPSDQAYDIYVERVRKYLAPAASHLTAAAGNDAMWKQLNQEVMLRSRSDEPAVRVGSLIVLQSFYERLGEEFLILLPETIPYLAELLEDDDSRVERATQETIKVIESHLGESLQSYLR